MFIERLSKESKKDVNNFSRYSFYSLEFFLHFIEKIFKNFAMEVYIYHEKLKMQKNEVKFQCLYCVN